MREKKLEIIRCPHCNTEYLPAEIFLPNSFIGKPSNIVKDIAGKILDFSGNSMDTKESFICDRCGTTFKVRTQLQFFTEIKNDNFNEDYKTSLKKDLFTLSEI